MKFISFFFYLKKCDIILITGYYCKEGTPVPISNTEVKLFSAEDSVSENRT